MSERFLLSDSAFAHFRALGILRDEEDTLAGRINKIHGRLQITGKHISLIFETFRFQRRQTSNTFSYIVSRPSTV